MNLRKYLVSGFFILLLSQTIKASINSDDSLNKSLKQNTYYSGINELLELTKVPAISLAVIQNKELEWAGAFGVVQNGQQERANTETMFSVGSISKFGTAALVLNQVDKGHLNLDTNVNQYLKQWQIPNNYFTREHPVTLKKLLSHTAGVNVHGFQDFQPGEKIPTTVEILQGKPLAKNPEIKIIFKPGTAFKYSGGGTTVIQLILEELFNERFDELANKHLFKPLKMSRSSYQNPLAFSFDNIAKAHDSNGNPRALPRGYESMPEMAASGLWTTPNNLSKLIISLMNSYAGGENGFITENATKLMMTPVEPGEFGLGPVISDVINFQHGGSNDSYKAFFKASLKTGNGYIIFTNGANGRAVINVLRKILEADLFSKI